MSGSPVSPDILRANIAFLRSLESAPGDIGVDRSGRLYIKGGMSLSNLFTRVHSRPEAVIRESVNAYLSIESAEALAKGDLAGMLQYRTALKATLIQLERHGILTPALREQILDDSLDVTLFYYQKLLAEELAKDEDGAGERHGSAPIAAAAASSSRATPGAVAASGRELPATPPEPLMVKKAKISKLIMDDDLIPNSRKKMVGFHPTSSDEGASGSYWITDWNGSKIGIFKPEDEEIGMPKNTSTFRLVKDTDAEGYSRGVRLGTMWKREIAASRFCAGKLGIVPETTYLEIEMPKGSGRSDLVKGSLQAFEPMGKTRLAAVIAHGGSDPIVDSNRTTTHGLFFRDMLIGSQDRHYENMLFRDRDVIGIDNGCSFAACYSSRSTYLKPKITSWLILSRLFKEVPDPSAKEELMHIDLEREIDGLLREDLISLNEALAIRMRHTLLVRLLEIDPPLTMEQ